MTWKKSTTLDQERCRGCAVERGLRPRNLASRGEVRKGGETPSELNSHDLDVDAPGTRAIQLGEQDRLEAPERQLASADAHGDAASEQRSAQVRVCVAALAIGEPGIVVPV